MIKNNWINRLIHKSHVAECQVEATRLTALYARRKEMFEALQAAQTLPQLLEVHKMLWREGYQSANIGPCSYGMFRTENIETMKPEEIYLGGIWGLYTKNIPFWEERKDEDYGCNGFGLKEDTKIYTLICNQYRYHLESNIRSIVSKAREQIADYCDLGYEIFYQQ